MKKEHCITLSFGFSEAIQGGLEPHPDHGPLCKILGNCGAFHFLVEPTIDRDLIELTLWQLGRPLPDGRDRNPDEQTMRLRTWYPYRMLDGSWVRCMGINQITYVVNLWFSNERCP